MLKYRKISFVEAISCCSFTSIEDAFGRSAVLAVEPSVDDQPAIHFVNISSYKYPENVPSDALRVFEPSALPAYGVRYNVSHKDTFPINM